MTFPFAGDSLLDIDTFACVCRDTPRNKRAQLNQWQISVEMPYIYKIEYLFHLCCKKSNLPPPLFYFTIQAELHLYTFFAGANLKIHKILSWIWMSSDEHCTRPFSHHAMQPITYKRTVPPCIEQSMCWKVWGAQWALGPGKRVELWIIRCLFKDIIIALRFLPTCDGTI